MKKGIGHKKDLVTGLSLEDLRSTAGAAPHRFNDTETLALAF